MARRAKLVRVIKPRDYSARWPDFIRPGNDIDWKDKRESDLQVAIKRWYDIVQSFPPSVGLRNLLDQQPSMVMKLEMIKNLLWNKSPATLVKRVNSMSRFVEYLKEHNLVFPGTESTFYDFLVAQQIKEVKALRLQGVLEALRFVKHVMDVPELEELIYCLSTVQRCS